MKRVLVTGGNGFIGSAVVRKLVASGFTVRCTLRQNSRTDRLNDLQYERAYADLLRPDTLHQAVQDCDAIIHCASLSNWKDLNHPELEGIIVKGTEALLHESVNRGIRMVYISSAAALGACHQPDERRDEHAVFNLCPTRYRYAALKSIAEQRCMDAVHQHNANVVIVNPAETYGPGDTDRVTASTLIEFASGPFCLVCRGGTAVIHVEDVADTILAALVRGVPGQRYLASGDNLSFRELALLVHETLGKKRPVLSVPLPLVRLYASLAAVVPVASMRANSVKYRYATQYWYFDSRSTQNELGVEFRSAKETVKQTLHWLFPDNTQA